MMTANAIPVMIQQQGESASVKILLNSSNSGDATLFFVLEPSQKHVAREVPGRRQDEEYDPQNERHVEATGLDESAQHVNEKEPGGSADDGKSHELPEW